MHDVPPTAQRQGGRRILLAITGLTPQVVTETLYALMLEEPQALPEEVHILTTSEGAERARLALLSEQPGWFHRLCRDFDLGPIDFGTHNIHVLHGTDGKPLSDIRSAADNACVADQVAELVRGFTEDATTQLHISMSGGRKTLGFFAGYALSLWGRDGDRLTHVLVSDPYESSWDFFYPTRYEHVIATRNGKLADCSQAEITLADLPFVRLRHGLPRELLSGQSSFVEAVAAAQRRLAPPSLTICCAGQYVIAAGKRIQIAPAELAFLSWFAGRAQSGLGGVPCPSDGAPSQEHATAYLAEYRRIRGLIGDDGRTAARYRHGMGKADFEERKSKLKRCLSAELGDAAQPYLVVGEGRRPMRFRLALPPDAVAFLP